MLLFPIVFSQQYIGDYKVLVNEDDVIIDTYDTKVIHLPETTQSFFAASSKSHFDTCTLIGIEDTVIIKNTGDWFEEYYIELQGSAAKYAVTVPNSVFLEPGQTELVTNYIQFPKNAIGTYDLEVIIKTNSGLRQSFTQEFNSKLCNNNHLLAINFNQTACPCLDMEFEFNVKNIGNHIETYTFGLDRYGEYANIDTNPLVLGPGEAKTVYLTLKLPCDIYGTQVIHFFSNAQSSGIISKVPLLLNINQCYDYGIETGKLVENDDDKFEVAFEDVGSNYNVCGGDSKSIQLRIENEGYIDNNISYNLTGPEWSNVYGDLFRLDGFEEGYTYVDLFPGENVQGDYKLTISANSEIGNIGEQTIFDVYVEDCYDIGIILPDEITECSCQQTSFNLDVFNYGKYDEDVNVKVNGPDFMATGELQATVESDSNQALEVELFPGCNISGMYPIFLEASTTKGKSTVQYESIMSIKPIEECFNLDIKTISQTYLTYDGLELPVSVLHTGIKTAQYDVEIEGPEWISADIDEFILEPGQTHSFKLMAIPENSTEGEYYVVLKVKSDNVVYQKELVFNLGEGKPFSERIKSFISYNKYWIISAFVIIVLLILALMVVKGRARTWKIRQIIKKDKKVKDKQPNSKLWVLLVILLLILILVSFSNRAILFRIFTLSWNFFLQYIWYFIIGFLVLILLLAFTNEKE